MSAADAYVVVVILLVVFGYPLVMRVIDHAMARTREQIVGLATVLLQSDRLDMKRKHRIQKLVEIHDSGWPMVSVVLRFPLVALGRAFGANRTDAAFLEIADEDTRDQIRELDDLFLKSVVSANPILSVVLALEVLVLFPVLVFARLWRTLPDDIVDYSLYRRT